MLAGGGSRRMGAEKAALLVNGQPLLARVVSRLAPVLPVTVVGPEHLAALVPGTRVLPDAAPGIGPAGGLLTALTHATAPCVFVLACDMPFVAPDLVRALVQRARDLPAVDALVLRTARGREPLHAVYSRQALALLAEGVADGERSLLRLLERLHVAELAPEEAQTLDPSGRSAYNANTPEQWAEALAWLAAHPEVE